MSSAASKTYDVLMVGGGNAAGYAAREFVAQNKQAGSFAIIGKESFTSYERPALSKAFLAKEGAPRLPGFHTCVGGGGSRQEPAWYAEQGIDFLTGTTVTDIDVDAKTVRTSDDAVIGYKNLVFATGARPTTLEDFSIPNEGFANVHYLRDVADGLAMVSAMESCAAGSSAVVLGGGYIGTEVTSQLVGRGFNVTMVVPEDYINFRVFTPEIAAVYEKIYADKGVKIVKGKHCKGIAADGTVTLNDGTALESSIVVVGIGARPNTQLLEGKVGMLEKAPGGVLCDEHLRTNVDGVFAIGDVAAFPVKMYGGDIRRLEHVDNARKQAAHVMKYLSAAGGAEEAGKLAGYDYLPFFYSRVFNLSWQFYGDKRGQAVHFGSRETPDAAAGGSLKFGAYFVEDGRVVGTFLENAGETAAEDFKVMARVARDRPEVPEGVELDLQTFA